MTSSVRLEFKTEAFYLPENEKSELLGLDGAILQETCFVLPVRLTIDDTELLALPLGHEQAIRIGSSRQRDLEPQYADISPSSWLPLPILHVAFVGSERVKEACQGKTSDYALPGTGMHLRFQPVEKVVIVYSTLNKRSAQTYCEDLLAAFDTFAQQVRQVLNDEMPELRQHPQIGKWLVSLR